MIWGKLSAAGKAIRLWLAAGLKRGVVIYAQTGKMGAVLDKSLSGRG